MSEPIVITTPEQLEGIISKVLEKHLLPSPAAAIEPVDIIDSAELCTRLNISPNTIVAYRNKGRIPFLLVGNVIRYNWYAVLKAITQLKK